MFSVTTILMSTLEKLDANAKTFQYYLTLDLGELVGLALLFISHLS
jgi:hypothetical protein